MRLVITAARSQTLTEELSRKAALDLAIQHNGEDQVQVAERHHSRDLYVKRLPSGEVVSTF
jgi:hypothetical protein